VRQLITRKGKFDFGHRVLNHRKDLNKCCNAHGHTALWELTLSFESQELEFGYIVDFGEIKRQFDGFVQEFLDHGWISNPLDSLLTYFQKESLKCWVMSLNGGEDCNPSCENICKELIYVSMKLFERYPKLRVYELKLYETASSFVTSDLQSLSAQEIANLDSNEIIQGKIREWISKNPVMEYDERKLS